MIELLTVDDVARITGLSPHTIRRAIRDCELPASRIRRRLRIHPTDLADWVDAGRVRPPVALDELALGTPAMTTPRIAPASAGSARDALRAARRKDAAA